MRTEPKNELEAIAASLEPPYRSTSETQIGRLLDHYGVPFFYQQPTLILDGKRHDIWHPDFTLPDYQDAVIEYSGGTRRPEGMLDSGHRQRVYESNGIAALIVTPADVGRVGWDRRLYERIENLGRRTQEASSQAYGGPDHRPYA